MPVESMETVPQLPAWEAGLLAMMGAMTKQKILLQQLLICRWKQRRSGTGLTSSVTGSQNSERASQQDATAHSRWTKRLDSEKVRRQKESKEDGPTRAELGLSHPQVTAISLAPTVSTAELEQMQQTPGLPKGDNFSRLDVIFSEAGVVSLLRGKKTSRYYHRAQ